MKYDELISNFFGFSIPTYYNWKREKRPIIKLIDKYFSEDELMEFLENERIAKLEILNIVESQIERDSFEVLQIFKQINQLADNSLALYFISNIFLEPSFRINDFIRLYALWEKYITYEEFEQIIKLLEDYELLYKYSDAIKYISLKKLKVLIKYGARSLIISKDIELFNISIKLYIFNYIVSNDLILNNQKINDTNFFIEMDKLYNKLKISNYNDHSKDYEKLAKMKIQEIEDDIKKLI